MLTKLSLAALTTGAAFLIFVLTAAMFSFYESAKDLEFFSEESANNAGDPVVNRIHFERRGLEDIWMMNQSHQGPNASVENWDRVAIVLNRQTKQAKFYQFVPGELSWPAKSQLEETEFKVSCVICHSNGTRAIRPLKALDGGPLRAADQFKVWRWNLRIKWYGLVQNTASTLVDGKIRERPLRFPGEFANERLKIAACTICHRDSGPFAHGVLTRQNSMTIKHMVKSRHMPMFGIPIPSTQLEELNRFVRGL